MAQSSFLFRLEVVLSSLDSVWVVCGARTNVLILCQVDDVIGVIACRTAQRWSATPPGGLLQAENLLDGDSDRQCLNRCH